MSGMGRREFMALLGGAVVGFPFPALAQQSAAVPVIGFMSSRSPEDSGHLVEAFRRGLKEGGGGVEGANFAIEYRWARGDYSRLPAFAAELVSRRVDVIATFGGDPSALAAKRATSTIPIVSTLPGDPISPGLVQSFNRPGGNVTGLALASDEMEPKRLGLLRELAPNATYFGGLVNPNFPPAVHQLQQLEEAARAISQRLIIAKASTDPELELASLTQGSVGALLVAADPYFDTRRDQIVSFAARHRLPAIYHFRDYVMAGGLLSYGMSITDAYRQCGVYAAKLLNGASPADLPVLCRANSN
jgi:putative tryptophan/tyrosine transport system substrate-binding protein